MPVKSSLGYSMSKKMSEIISWTFENNLKLITVILFLVIFMVSMIILKNESMLYQH